MPVPDTRKSPDIEMQVVSDLHISATQTYRRRRFEHVLASIAALAPSTAALVVVGDMTDYGMPWEYGLFARAVRRSALSGTRLVCAFGNHEYRIPPYRLDWHRFSRRIGIAHPYHDTMVESIHLIALAGDAKPDRWDHGCLSEAQLAWLEQLLADDDRTETTAFVFNHEPLFDTVEGSHPDQQSGDSIVNDRALRAVLDRHPRAFVFTGHSHYRLDARRVGTGPVFANTGAIGYDENYGKNFAQGWFICVTADEVIMRGRDFIQDTWMQEYRFRR